MRSLVIAFSLLAAAVGPSLVSGAPTFATELANALAPILKAACTPQVILAEVGGLTSTFQDRIDTPPSTAHTDDPVHRIQAMKLAEAQSQKVNDPAKAATMPSASQDSSGGDGQGGITNADDLIRVGSSFSGIAFGGSGNGHGRRDLNVANISKGIEIGDGDVNAIDNTLGNMAGGGGFSESGSAEGGDASGPSLPAGVFSATGDVLGDSVDNSADDQGTVTNNGGNTAGGAGTTFSGDSGNGTGLGPGKYAYTDESSGPATSGSVYNYGGTIDNAEDSNAAGGGGVGQTGDAQRILTAFHCIY